MIGMNLGALQSVIESLFIPLEYICVLITALSIPLIWVIANKLLIKSTYWTCIQYDVQKVY